MPDRIVTERLLLRRHAPADAELLKTTIDASLQHLRRWMAWAMEEPSPIEVIRERVARFGRAFDAGEDWGYLIFDRAEREILGGAGVHRVSVPNKLELGYWLRADTTGQGFVTEAIRALTRAAFGVPGITCLEIRCDPKNVRSAAVPARLGYRHVTTLLANTVTPTGQPRDTMVWQIRTPRPTHPNTLTEV